ncbi:response regulator [Frondihabitans sp. Leaf304]|jgi:DNA-binding NarL/FixJ family response regulator|uniref:response regulator n=1 Tax=Frondihabitans sp. Leaf304 TaxID=1736329 RepID=UPI0006FD4161|nr:response regulator transcription factor [Frondihabitans sp. Leaf304]KQQ28902.1 LuxR family transcriptional regulator [Frondihabitans sp. Leaf304]
MTDISLLLVDDQDLLRAGMAMVLGAVEGIRVVGEATNGGDAISRAAELAPDVVLMDVRMPGIDGIEATRQIVAANAATRVIILTTFDLDEYAFGGLNAGASGFLLKDAPSDELIQAIHTVAAGEAIISPRVTQRMLEMYRGKMPETSAGAPSPLSDREQEVLVAIGRGLSNTEIAASLFLSESTVKTHVGRVLAKLELRDRVQAVIYAYQQGLV